jgi:hypothetical protein
MKGPKDPSVYFLPALVGPAGVDQVALGAKKLFKQLQRDKVK